MANITIDTNTTWTEDKEYDDILITNGATLTIDSHNKVGSPDTQIVIKCKNLTIDAGAKISLDGKGFLDEEGPSPGITSGGSGGGAYGGAGGDGGSYDTGSGEGGTAYGDESKAEQQGSGGGDCYCPTFGSHCSGGYGGGAVKIISAGTVLINGTLSANGTDGGTYTDEWDRESGGGGAGGGIYIISNRIEGSGTITANGGEGHYAVVYTNYWTHGGGGGGGRIVIDSIYNKEPFSITTEANGGTGYNNGSNGTIFTNIAYVKDVSSQLQLPHYNNISNISKIVFRSQKDYLNQLSLYIAKHFLNKIDLHSAKDVIKSLLQLYFRKEIKQKLDLRITHNFKEIIKLLFHDLLEFSSQIQLPSYQNFKAKVRCHFPSESQYILPFTDFYIDPDDNIYKGIYLQADKNGLGYNKILMKFDLTNYTETIPQSLLHLYNFTEGWDNATVSVYRITEDWDDSSVKNNILTDDYPITTIDISNAGEYTLDITSLINNWINGTYQNYGLLITYTDNNYLTYRNFGSTRYPLNQYHPYLSLSIYSLFTQKIKLIQPSAPLIDSWAIQTAWQSKRISWEKPKDTRLIGYNAYRSSDGGDTWEQMNSVLIPADTTYFIITGMDALVSNQWVSAITSVIKYGNQTKESDKQISRDVWGTRYLIDWPDIANSYVIYKA